MLNKNLSLYFSFKFLSIFFLLFFGITSTYAKEKLKPLDRSQEVILSELKKKYSSAYNKYLGFQGTYNLEIKELDPNQSNKLISLAHAKVIRKEYFYKKPELKVLSFERNGKTLKPSEYNPPSFEPIYPFFDEDAEKHYQLTVIGIMSLNNREVYKIRVTPLKKGIRYFKGFLYVDKNKMSLASIRGTISANYFFLKEFDIKLRQKDIKNVTSMYGSVIQTRVHVPMMIKDRRFITIMKGIKFELIAK